MTNYSAVHESRNFDLFCWSRSWSLFTSGKTISAANYNRTLAKKLMIDNYGILCYFVHYYGVCKTVERVLIFFENFIKFGVSTLNSKTPY